MMESRTVELISDGFIQGGFTSEKSSFFSWHLKGMCFRFLYPSLLSLLLDGDYPDGGHWYISLAYPLKKKHLIFMFFLSIQKRTAYILNLRGSDIPYNPLFHAYLFVGLESAVLFVEKSKVQDGIWKRTMCSWGLIRIFGLFCNGGNGEKGRWIFLIYYSCETCFKPNSFIFEGYDRTSNFICHLAHVDAFPIYIGTFLYWTYYVCFLCHFIH